MGAKINKENLSIKNRKQKGKHIKTPKQLMNQESSVLLLSKGAKDVNDLDNLSNLNRYSSQYL